MKIINYSDKPVYIKTVPIEDTEIYIPPYFERWIVKHNNQDFIPPSYDDRNIILTIRNTGVADQYVYKSEEFTFPNVFPLLGVFMAFFGFFIVIKLIQKIRTR